MEYNYYSISIEGFFKRSYVIYKDTALFLSVERRSFFSNEHVFYDAGGKEIMYLKKPFSLFSYTYKIFENNILVGEVKKENFSTNYILDTIENHLVARTNLLGTEFTFYNGDAEVAKGTRKMFARVNAYQIAIQEGFNDLHFLATLIAISLTRQAKKRKQG